MKYVKSTTNYDDKCRVTPNMHETVGVTDHKRHLKRKKYQTVTEWLGDE